MLSSGNAGPGVVVGAGGSARGVLGVRHGTVTDRRTTPVTRILGRPTPRRHRQPARMAASRRAKWNFLGKILSVAGAGGSGRRQTWFAPVAFMFL
jgi:hypothetical protein